MKIELHKTGHATLHMLRTNTGYDFMHTSENYFLLRNSGLLEILAAGPFDFIMNVIEKDNIYDMVINLREFNCDYTD